MKTNNFFSFCSGTIPALLFLFFFCFSSCKKKPCETAVCLNGGACVDGKCKCAPGYSGQHCEEYDLCYNVICENEAYCINGECICIDGWTGENCNQRTAPSTVKILKIEVLRFPFQKQSGGPWDSGMFPDNKPDIYIDIQKDSVIIWANPLPHQNAVNGTVYYFMPSTPVNLSSPLAQHSISLYDSDPPNSPELMGKMFFVPYIENNGFPQTMILDLGGPLAFKIYLEYAW